MIEKYRNALRYFFVFCCASICAKICNFVLANIIHELR